MVDDEVITYYFELNKRIAKVKGRLKKMRFDFYQQTMSSYCTSDEQKIYTKGISKCMVRQRKDGLDHKKSDFKCHQIYSRPR